MSAVPAAGLAMVPMHERDLEAIMLIENDIYAFPWTAGNFRDALKAGYSGWTLRCGDQLLGYAVLMMAVDEGHLLNISIAASQQRRGFGARLLLHVMDCARRAGASSLMLEVRPSNDKAIELYRHFGFEQIGVRRNYYPAPVGREDAVILRRPLTEVLA